MLPSILAKQLQKGIGDYIETTFPMTNAPFRGSLEKLLSSKNSVFHEPYIAVRLPFRVAEKMPECFEALHPKYLPYVHQEKAFSRLVGDDGRSTLIATGTGSGKTECFLYPVLEYCYQHRGERGIKALIIYPMNALASDQAKRIAELIFGSPELYGNVTVGMYVGGREQNPNRMMTETDVITDHDTLLNNPPDILLTNYKMLDYLLVRPKDAALWKDNKPDTLKYIAVDELHTFDGAQGTDLACLLRRLKTRLWTPVGYLCCIGTSATMGTSDRSEYTREYAIEVFGEPFEEDSVITEDRLSSDEFFDGYDITEFKIPALEETERLETYKSNEDEAYLRCAVSCWFDDFTDDVMSEIGRINLGQRLMHHSFVHSIISLMGNRYCQAKFLMDKLKTYHPEISTFGSKDMAINSLFALISHARAGSEGHLRPFLNLQVQLWMRELRRLMAKVSDEDLVYSIAHDLNKQQSKQYLPVVNCRDCGVTGWVTVLNERQNATMTNLEAFYNLYFRPDKKVTMMFPYPNEENINRMLTAKLCPECLKVTLSSKGSNLCDQCGTETIPILIPSPIETSGSKDHKQYVCPFCGSRRGLSLMGLRSATEISSSISQLFASRFNDDKKTLAFSDNVQDAAHRAGFFNSRTWGFCLRLAMQRYVEAEGAGKSLGDFTKGFISFWHAQMSNEDFISYFIAPNMTWMKAYENMKDRRKLGSGEHAKKLMKDVELRLSYEIMLEYGMKGRIGRTLEKSGSSVISFDKEIVKRIASTVQEYTVNNIGILRYSHTSEFEQMVIGFLNIMRLNGAFDDPAFYEMIKNNGNPYFLSSDRVRWMPGLQSGRNTPRFIVDHLPQRSSYKTYDLLTDKKYTNWIVPCCSEAMIEISNYEAISRLIFEELQKENIIVSLPSPADHKVYGLNKDKLFISDQVKQVRCDSCGSLHSVPEENLEFWTGSPCLRKVCGGNNQLDGSASLDYYGKLFSFGDMTRINAKEHTGLLERDIRERLEDDFKRDKKDHAHWDPNVLSCTPTLEMGIDIGDLSTVILCSIPPAQAQFLQRAGRAGRRDGNSLTVAVANAKPHDLYFYADPLDMIDGDVNPPKIFLRASAVLERQFVAYCMDSWVKRGATEDSIPKNVGIVLSKLEKHPVDVFPFNLLIYVQNNLSALLRSFIQLFTQYLDDNAKEELRIFAQGNKLDNSPMHIKILESFQSLKKQRDSLALSIKQLRELIRELEARPKDSSYDEEIKELRSEQTALRNVLRELNNKNIFNFLSDEGLLPNYAFPEAGIVLKAVLYRQEEPDEEEQDEESGTSQKDKRKYEKMVYEYSRAASSAISEFAPNNSFYIDGRKLKIDQIDLTTAQTAKWRLCPSCSHAQIEEAGKNTSFCPQCGSPAWADSGQLRTMLKVQMVYSNMDYTKSLIGDESDDRSNVFYCKQLLVDVDEDNDISSAYRIDNEEFAFGYEFVKKAILREINFGESDIDGDKVSISGIEEVRNGFKICKYCGKMQPDHGKPNHTYFCKTRRNLGLSDEPFEECLFLYREFTTEILRLLIPATTEDSSTVRTESFVAAFMLGMKEYFGNVDHLRSTVTEVPVPNADYRKQYLVIYDSVPGGTGYLKQLMNGNNTMIEIFERALSVLESCSCKDDPQKDGCYHCLYAYRQSQKIGNISRSTAIRLLRTILSGKDNIEVIEKLGAIPVNPLFESELERRFIEAIAQMGNDSRKVNISKALVNGKEGYILKVDDSSWEIEPQVLLDASKGVSVKCKPDFIISPVSAIGRKPIAIFTDGFIYHKDNIADDTLKREAIRRSGLYRVWCFSWKDVQTVSQTQEQYSTNTLSPSRMPSGSQMYQQTIKSGNAEILKPDKVSTFELLMNYLAMPDAEAIFETHAKAYSLSLLEPKKMNSLPEFDEWHLNVSNIIANTNLMDDDFNISDTLFGTWSPRSENMHLNIYSGILTERLKQDKTASAGVYAVLEDRQDLRTDKYEEEWNGFWQFFNIMQFLQTFIAVSNNGLDAMSYLLLPLVNAQIPTYAGKNEAKDESKWDDIYGLLFDKEAKHFAGRAKNLKISAPDEIGYDLVNDIGEVVATVEMAWTDVKVAYMTIDQLEYRSLLEKLGWVVLNEKSEINTAIFGGAR